MLLSCIVDNAKYYQVELYFLTHYLPSYICYNKHSGVTKNHDYTCHLK